MKPVMKSLGTPILQLLIASFVVFACTHLYSKPAVALQLAGDCEPGNSCWAKWVEGPGGVGISCEDRSCTGTCELQQEFPESPTRTCQCPGEWYDPGSCAAHYVPPLTVYCDGNCAGTTSCVRVDTGAQVFCCKCE